MNGLAFSTDGRCIALTGDGEIGVWEVRTGRQLRSFRGHLGEVKSVVFSPDGRKLVTGGIDGTAVVWDLTNLPLEEQLGVAPAPGRVEQLWKEMAAPDVMKSYQAFREMQNASGPGLASLGKQIRSSSTVDSSRIVTLIEALGSEEIEALVVAYRELKSLGYRSEGHLLAALKQSPSQERKKWMEKLVEASRTSPERRRHLWGVRLLELVGTREARQLLKDLIKESPESLQAGLASDALERLKCIPVVEKDPWAGEFGLWHRPGGRIPAGRMAHSRLRIDKVGVGYRVRFDWGESAAVKTFLEERPGILRERGGSGELRLGHVLFPDERRRVIRLGDNYFVAEPEQEEPKTACQ